MCCLEASEACQVYRPNLLSVKFSVDRFDGEMRRAVVCDEFLNICDGKLVASSQAPPTFLQCPKDVDTASAFDYLEENLSDLGLESG